MASRGASFVPSLRLAATMLLLAASGAGLLIAGLQIAESESPGPVAVQRRTAEGEGNSGEPVAVAGSARSAGIGSSEEPPAQLSRRSAQYAFAWPVAGSISQGMSPRHPSGIDVRAGIGDPITAVRAGRVRFAGGDPCCVFGYYVIVDHDDGWSTLYGHLSEILVTASDDVQQGDTLGLAGNTGRSDGAHLHLELWSHDRPVNPLSYLEPPRSYVPVLVEATADESTPTPEPEPLPQDQAIAQAVRWMEGPAGDYAVQRGSCFAIAAGPNWSVSCSATLVGCQADICDATLEACVVGPLSLVEATCSGYAPSGTGG